MARKIPNCAYCGHPLKLEGVGRLTVSFLRIKGAPTVGWHSKPCASKDKKFMMFACENQDDELIVRKVLARGRSRVSAGPRFNPENFKEAKCSTDTK